MSLYDCVGTLVPAKIAPASHLPAAIDPRTYLLPDTADLASTYIFADTVDKLLHSFVAYASSPPAGTGVLKTNSYTLFVLDFGVAEEPYGYTGSFSAQHLLSTVQHPKLVDTLNN